jgi:nucleoid DNA-binding protein
MTYADAERVWDSFLQRFHEALLVEGGSVVLTNVGTLTAYASASRSFRLPDSEIVERPKGVLAVRFQTSRNLREQHRRSA